MSCHNCTERLRVLFVTEVSSVMYCPNCGTLIEKDTATTERHHEPLLVRQMRKYLDEYKDNTAIMGLLLPYGIGDIVNINTCHSESPIVAEQEPAQPNQMEYMEKATEEMESSPMQIGGDGIIRDVDGKEVASTVEQQPEEIPDELRWIGCENPKPPSDLENI